MRTVVVYGAGGMGKEVAEAVMAAADAGLAGQLRGFVDDAAELSGTEVLGCPVLGDAQWVIDHRDTDVVIGFGHPWRRRVAAMRLAAAGVRLATIIDPRAHVSRSAAVGEGAVISAGCVVASGASLGAGAYLNYNAVVSHDAVLGDFASLMAQVAISGGVQVGQGAFIGVGTSTRQRISIGEWCLVGAGSVVISNLPPLCVAYGVPAAPMRYYERPDDMPPI
jgi:sugar O-acyltransferase (sialic acid O-acetyltransferase NeuD family)